MTVPAAAPYGRLLPASAVALTAAAGILVWALGGAGGLVYVLLFVLATVPGWPVGWALFGRRHAAGWIAGSLLGYVLSGWALWATARLGGHSAGSLVAGWIVLCVLTGLLVRIRTPLVTLPAWSRRDWAALLVVLLLVPAIVGPPFLNLGAEDAQGNHCYRAYFTADFLWHVALTHELRQFVLPPVDPYAAGTTLHYYWTYFLVPAAALNTGLLPGLDVEPALKVNALCAGLLFVATVFLAAWRMTPRAAAVAAGVALALLAASAEGLYALWVLHSRNAPLAAVRTLNIDAITMWFLGGLTIDGLPRSLWYTPQHAMACACGLVALIVGASERVSSGAAAAAGLALAAAVTVSPFLGGAFALVYGVGAVVTTIRYRQPFLSAIARRGLAAVPTLLAVAWTLYNQMLEGAGGALQLGFRGQATVRPVLTLLLAIGPVLVPAVLGLWHVRRLPSGAIPFVAALVVGLGLFYLVSIGRTDPVWVGWRAGQVLLVTMPGLVAAFVAGSLTTRPRRVACGVLLLVAFAAGLPTTAIDTYNAQDISNRAMGPGFPWTVTVDPAQQAAFAWIRRETPREAVVQMEPMVRGRATWTLIPTFAGRRMAAGLPISLVAQPYYQARSQSVRELYGTIDGPRAWALARGLKIDYLYVDDVERGAYSSAALQKFDHDTELFHLAFRSGHVAIYEVLTPRTGGAS